MEKKEEKEEEWIKKKPQQLDPTVPQKQNHKTWDWNIKLIQKFNLEITIS